MAVSPVKLSVIEPAVAVNVTEPSASIFETKILPDASKIIAPLSAPSIDWVNLPLSMVIFCDVPCARSVINPPTDVILSFWAILFSADVIVIAPTPELLIILFVVIKPSAFKVIVPVVPDIALSTVIDLSVPVSLASIVIAPLPVVDTPVPEDEIVILPFSVLISILPLPPVCAAFKTIKSPPADFSLTTILPVPSLVAVIFVSWVKPRSIPVCAVIVKSLAIRASDEVESPVSSICLILPDSEYKVIFELSAFVWL